MNVLNKTIITNLDWFSLWLFGDWHIGQEACDEDKIKSASKYLSTKNSKEGGVIVLGDLIENVVLGSKGTHFDLNISSPEKQMDRAAEYLDLFKHLVLGCVEGNHELRTRHRTGQYLCKSILDKVYAKDTKDYYLNINGIINLQFKNSKGKNLQKYKIYVTHGVGNSGSISGKLAKIHTLKDHADADIYCQGHLHHKLGMCDYIVNRNDVLCKRIFACCSSYLFNAGYAEEFGYRPTDYGINTISINTKESNMIGYY